MTRNGLYPNIEGHSCDVGTGPQEVPDAGEAANSSTTSAEGTSLPSRSPSVESSTTEASSDRGEA